MFYLLIGILTCCACSAQSISVGLIGGGRLNDDISVLPGIYTDSAHAKSEFSLESKFYDVGPTAEIGIGHGFAFEFDALYHRQGFSLNVFHDTQYTYVRERDNIWEFPLLLKYMRRVSTLNLFVETGVAPRKVGGGVAGVTKVSLYTPVQPLPLGPSDPTSYDASVGFVAGTGLEFSWRSLRLNPQVRYTRWSTTPLNTPYDYFGSSYSSNQNQVDIMVGISWKVK